MQNIKTILLVFVIFPTIIIAQNVGINETGAVADPSAGLDIDFDDKGILIPRVALTETTNAGPIAGPVNSLLVYNTATVNDVTPGFYYWFDGEWVNIGAGSGGDEWQLEGNAGTDPSTNFLGTTDAQDLVFRTDNLERARVSNDGNFGIATNNPQGKLHISLDNDNNEPATIDKANGSGNGPLTEWYGFSTTHRLQLQYQNSPFRYEFNTDQASRNIAFAPNQTLSLFLDAGNQNVGIKTTNPTADLDIDGTIRIRGGNPDAGDVLTSSDNNGNATWESISSWTLRHDDGTTYTTVPTTDATWTSIPLGYTPDNSDRFMIEFQGGSTSNSLEKGVAIVGHGTFSFTNGMSTVSYTAYDGVNGGVLDIATYSMQWRINGDNIQFRYPTKTTQGGTSTASTIYVRRVWSAPKE